MQIIQQSCYCDQSSFLSGKDEQGPVRSSGLGRVGGVVHSHEHRLLLFEVQRIEKDGDLDGAGQLEKLRNLRADEADSRRRLKLALVEELEVETDEAIVQPVRSTKEEFIDPYKLCFQ